MALIRTLILRVLTAAAGNFGIRIEIDGREPGDETGGSSLPRGALWCVCDEPVPTDVFGEVLNWRQLLSKFH